MKTSLPLLLVLAGAALAGPGMTDRVTPAEIASRQTPSPLQALQEAAPEAEAKVARATGQSLIAQSDILHDGRNWTIVPKGAVLHIPAALAPRVGARPLGTLLTWNEFLTVNRGWVFTEEVTMDQAAGERPIGASRMDFWAKNGKVIVAVHLGGPISVRKEALTPVATLQ